MAQRILAVVLQGEDGAAGFARRMVRSKFEADVLLAGTPKLPPGSWRTAWKLPSAAPLTVASALADLVAGAGYTALIFDDTPRSREIAGRVAMRLGLPIAASVMNVRSGSGGLAVTRTAEGGARTANLVLSREPALVVANPEAAEEAGTSDPAVEETRDLPAVEIASPVELLNETRLMPNEMDLTDADVVVAGGRGLGGPKGFAMLEELAGLLGGTVGASRVAVDAGWIPYARQIGLTGKSVTPRLYIACGISGALHHTLGMRHANTIVAINSDPNAPIFDIANVSVVANLHEFIPSLIKELRGRTGRQDTAMAGTVP